ncbi:NB-ARC domain-containing protein [Planktothricoides raciborskii]|uniref:ATPase n=1 Tax=Planktothricoides raciborskii FACHB-1370 TaxID=2949576 RepID=A0ABR8EL11_9CYAN|nr:NB-ARC domain-containing protein [Planktothricoides raciborskii]MBD2547002.1 ATPase [Planktothricoides raciborskii FACHB-1370]MBD2584625.1 ATPase [Planktothricoides raciborskii FACHB-1261]
MDIDVLKFTDSLFFSETGQHINRLQKVILTGTLHGQKYSEIAKAENCTEGHVRNVASQLWQVLSNALEQEVNKSNLSDILHRYNFSIIISSEFVNINQMTLCNNIQKLEVINNCSPVPPSPPAKETPTQLHIDLGDAPEIFTFYDSPRGDFASRTTELATLEQWIVNDSYKSRDIPNIPTRLVAILGISGIGKTALAIRLIDRIKTQFNYVIYRSLRFSPPLETMLTNLLQIFSESAENYPPVWGNQGIANSQIFNYLRQHRCLIVFDDVEALFSDGKLAGQYKPGYEDYQRFFQQVAEVNHHSCFILISSEQPREIAELEKSNYPIHSLVLGGIGIAAKDILTGHQLSDESMWETLINLYQGNPLWLNITATLIAELFGGSVADFLQYDMPMLDESLRWRLEQQFQRLTEPEIAVITQLAYSTEAVALSQLLNELTLSPTELINAVRSLVRRFIVETEERGKITCFTLNPVVAQYVKTRQ